MHLFVQPWREERAIGAEVRYPRPNPALADCSVNLQVIVDHDFAVMLGCLTHDHGLAEVSFYSFDAHLLEFFDHVYVALCFEFSRRPRTRRRPSTTLSSRSC